ncbi:O-antigen ligase family protein [Bacteroides sp. 224]|uniref:O-antigen ligase family protein n=1 Tax=Bacteroides sp. 224 TaxID=2302936 RepID=UPI0013D16EDC|nr:O-antigen ligase family protein [Bacteroides sp. 224]NDV65515.1 hypothetical protein [Bacteroides sp. 224]
MKKITIKQILKYLWELICLLAFGTVFSTVFIILPELAQNVTSSKYFWFYASMGILSFLLFFRYILFQSPIHYQFSWIDLIVTFIVGYNLFIYWNKGCEISTKVILLILCSILYFYFRLFLAEQRKSQRYILLLFLMLTGLIEAIWGLCQLYGFTPSYHGSFKVTGSLFNPGPYAGYLAMIIPIAFHYMLKDYRVLNKRWNIRFFVFYLRWGVATLTFIAILIILPAAMSRASWLGAIGGCIWVGVIYLLRHFRIRQYIVIHKKRMTILAIILLGCFCAGGAGLYFLKKDSADGRALMWKVSLQAIPHYPMGVGLGYFPGIYGNEQATYFASGQATEQEEYVAGSPEYAFSEYLQVCLEQGILVFVLLVIMIGIALCTGYKKNYMAEMGALCALLIFAFMSYPFSILPFVIVLAYLLAACGSLAIKKREVNSEKRTNRVLALVGFAITILCLYNRYPTYQAYKDWRISQMLYNLGHYPQAQKAYTELELYLEDQVNFLFEYGRILSQTETYKESNRILKKGAKLSADPMFYNIMGKNYQAMKEYNEAENALLKSTHLVPNRMYPWYLLTKLYIEMGLEEKAVETAKVVLTKEPKVHSTAVEEMRMEVKELIKSKK